MKFLIRAHRVQIERMCSDLDKEIKAAKKIQDTGRYKMASRLVQKVVKMPLMMIISYKRLNENQIELTVTTSADGLIKSKKIADIINKRIREYGSDVIVEVLEEDDVE